MGEVVLECKNLYKKIGRKEIIKDVSLSLEEGDILGFIGPNGAGKTTTIKLILGLQKIDKGEVIINGFDVKNRFEKAIEKVGAMVDNSNSYSYLSGYKNLKLISNLYKNITEERIKEVVTLVGLQNRINDKVYKYSLGMKQRLLIAEAILHKPNILILDEPTNGLDPEGIRDLREILVTLAKKEKMAILVSSHNLSELESFCTKVCIIKSGTTIEERGIDEINKNEDEVKYIVEVEDISVVKENISNIEIVDDHHFKLYLNIDEVSNFVIKLKDCGINIYEVKKEKNTLEETFLKRIGGNKID